MTQPIEIGLGLNVDDYVAGAGRALNTTNGLNNQLAALSVTAAGVQRALSVATPSRVTVAAFGAFGAAAAQSQQELSTLQARTLTAGQSFSQLRSGIGAVAREFPIGTAGARATVQQLQQLGISGQGAERRLVALAGSFTRLSGASGENAQFLAQQQVQLSRIYGQSDVKRIEAFNDSLTTTAAKSGASVSGILTFAKAIAPMAQAAGIGQSATQGIAASFTRLGEDGFLAANTFNKVLSDLNRSVREGGNEMAAYADITGTTVEQFERLYKTNPTEAITRVTESIAKAGAQGPRQLESIGIEGVRGQRTLQALAAGGGLRAQVETAVNSYGNGSTEEAAKAAFGGLNDALTQVQTTAGQTAVALGRPLLGPLEGLTKALGAVSNVTRAAAESRGGQAAITAALAAAGLIGAARIGVRVLAGTALVQQAATSGPVRGLLGGYAVGRAGGDTDAARGTRAGRYGAAMIDRSQAGTLNAGTFGRVNEGAYGLSERIGRQRLESRERIIDDTARRTGVDPAAYRRELASRQGGGWRGAVSRAAVPFSLAYEAQARLAGDAAAQMGTRDARRDPGLRSERSGLRAQGAFRDLGQGLAAAARGGGDEASRLRATGQAFSRFNDQLRTGATGMGNFNRVVRSTGFALGATGRYGASVLGSGAASAGRGLAGLAGGPAGLALIGALGTAGIVTAKRGERDEESQRISDLNIYDALNTYRDSMGKAGEAGQSLADQALVAAQVMNEAVETFDRAAKVTGEDISQAGTSTKVTREIGGSASQIAAQIGALNVKGVTPDELQSIKIDLLRQYSPDFVQQVLKAVPVGPQSSTGTADVGELVRGAAGVESENFLQRANSVSAGGVAPRSRGGLIRGAGDNLFAAGGLLDFNKLSEQATNALDTVSQTIGQRYQQQSDEFGNLYAEQERIRSANRAAQDAAATGDDQVFAELTKRLSKQLTGQERTYQRGDLEGTSLVDLLSEDDQAYRQRVGELRKQGVAIGATGGVSAINQQSPLAKQLAGFPTIGGFYDNTRPDASQTPPFLRAGGADQTGLGPVDRSSDRRRAVVESLDAPENTSKFTKAIDAMLEGGREAGASFGELAAESTEAANALRNTASAAYQQQRALAQQAEFRLNAVAPEQTPGEAFGDRFELNRRRAALDPNNAELTQDRQAGQQGLVEQRQQVVEQLKARLALQRQSDITVRRAREDQARSEKYAAEDFALNTFRAEEAFQIQVTRSNRQYQMGRQRSIADYQLSVARSEEDFNRQREREEKDFNRAMLRAAEDYQISMERAARDQAISVARAEEDYRIARLRAQRDFGVQMTRLAEDQAKSIYDPFRRIQTQAVWDGQQLLMNLQEQNAAMERQAKNLDRIRNMGLSQQAIDQLGLSRSENAQQLDRLVGDAQIDPRLLAQINASAKNRQGLAGVLNNAQNSQDTRRAQEDFRKSLTDQENDFRRSMARSRADFRKGLADSRADYNRSVARQQSDHSRAMRRAANDFERTMDRSHDDFNRTLDRNREDFIIALRDMANDFSRQRRQAEQDQQRSLNRQRAQFALQLRRMREDVNEQGKVIAGSFETLHTQTLKALNGKSVEWGGLMVDGLKDTLGKIKELQPEWNAAMGGFSFQPSGIGGGLEGSNAPASPLKGRPEVNSAYGNRRDPFTGQSRFHDGIDYDGNTGDDVYSVLPGKVIFAGMAGGYGNQVKIDHGGGRATSYSHLNTIDVRNGQQVGAGQDIGDVGSTGRSTGSHLHFMAYSNGKSTNPSIVKTWTYGAAPTLSAGGNPSSNERLGRSMAESLYGWGGQANALDQLWTKESGWRNTAQNPTSTAYGIPQFLNSTWATVGGRKTSDPGDQIRYGLKYIKQRYGDPEGAWRFWKANNWYGSGSIFSGPKVIGVGERGPEAVIPLNARGAGVLAEAMSKVLTKEQANTIATAGHASQITYVSEQHDYDQRVVVSGPIRVESGDPDEMGRKLAAKARRDSLAPMARRR